MPSFPHPLHIFYMDGQTIYSFLSLCVHKLQHKDIAELEGKRKNQQTHFQELEMTCPQALQSSSMLISKINFAILHGLCYSCSTIRLLQDIMGFVPIWNWLQSPIWTTLRLIEYICMFPSGDYFLHSPPNQFFPRLIHLNQNMA